MFLEVLISFCKIFEIKNFFNYLFIRIAFGKFQVFQGFISLWIPPVLIQVPLQMLDNIQVLVKSLSHLKVELPASKNNCFVCFNGNPLKIIKIILKALFVLRIFKFLF